MFQCAVSGSKSLVLLAGVRGSSVSCLGIVRDGALTRLVTLLLRLSWCFEDRRLFWHVVFILNFTIIPDAGRATSLRSKLRTHLGTRPANSQQIFVSMTSRFSWRKYQFTSPSFEPPQKMSCLSIRCSSNDSSSESKLSFDVAPAFSSIFPLRRSCSSRVRHRTVDGLFFYYYWIVIKYFINFFLSWCHVLGSNLVL